MTDLEMTKLCAEAMKLDAPTEDGVTGKLLVRDFPYASGLADFGVYDPLHDDAQAMALVKSETLDVTWGPGEQRWRVGQFRFKSERGMKEDGLYCECRDSDLNRAIVECVAKMQGGKK